MNHQNLSRRDVLKSTAAATAGLFFSGSAFAAGHAEIHRWRKDETMPPLVRDGYVNDSFRAPHSPDVRWLQEHSTRLRHP